MNRSRVKGTPHSGARRLTLSASVAMVFALAGFALLPFQAGGHVLAATTYAATVLGDSPVSYWRLGELSGTTASDSSTGGNNGTYTGGYTLGAPGAITTDTDTAVQLNGSTGYVNVPDKSNLDMTGDMSVELWAKPGALNATTQTALQKGINVSNSSGWQYRIIVNSSNRWQGSVFVGKSKFEIADNLDTLSTSRWDYLVLVRSGLTLTFYVNGQSVGSIAIKGVTNSTTGALAFGRAGSYPKSYFNGSVDEVAVYNTALSLTQIQNHLTAAGGALPTPTPAPTATATATPAPTATATATPGPTATSTPIPAPTATNTPGPAATPTDTPAPTATNTPAPTATSTPSGTDPVVIVAGDLACDPGSSSYNGGNGTSTDCQAKWTAAELSGATAVLAIGDEQYDCATLTNFQLSYALSWGLYKAITYPAVGNHEYKTTCAGSTNGTGYYSYFGPAASPLDTNCTSACRGYYSYTVGGWHIIVLNSECAQVGGCQAGSAQEQWLQADLAANPAACTLAYFHRPYYTSGWSLGDSELHDIWADLYAAHADLVLNGHDHDYERFLPQDANGVYDPARGITEIIVGTGGMSHGGFNSTAANSVVRDGTTYGVLKLTLHATAYDWQFVGDGQSGGFSDAGSASCH